VAKALGTIRRPGAAVLELLQHGEQHIDALTATVYGSLGRRQRYQLLATIARLRRAGHRVVYDRRRRMYALAG
jgi:hypothetical protein